jgi:hypothetical protein
MKSLRVGVAALGLLAGVLAGSAEAAPVIFGWDLFFTQGPLAGQDFRGTLSVNGCPTSTTCSGNFAAPPPATPLSLLSLNITVAGVAFAINNDTGFGSGFPDVTFDNSGHLSAIDYQGVVTVGANTFVLDTSDANIGENVAFYRGAVGAPIFGSVSIARLGVVPEPGTIPLLAAGVIGVLLAGRRRGSNGAAKLAA